LLNGFLLRPLQKTLETEGGQRAVPQAKQRVETEQVRRYFRLKVSGSEGISRSPAAADGQERHAQQAERGRLRHHLEDLHFSPAQVVAAALLEADADELPGRARRQVEQPVLGVAED